MDLLFELQTTNLFSGLAESPSDFKTLQFKDWFEDCQTAIEIAKEENKGCPGGLVLVGSSMGGWISLKMALDNKALINGLVLIAPAYNYMWFKYQVNVSLGSFLEIENV